MQMFSTSLPTSARPETREQSAHVEMKERGEQKEHQLGGFDPTSGEETKEDVRGGRRDAASLGPNVAQASNTDAICPLAPAWSCSRPISRYRDDRLPKGGTAERSDPSVTFPRPRCPWWTATLAL